MKKRIPFYLSVLFVFFLVSSSFQSWAADFAYKDLSQKISSGEYRAKVDNFLIIFDASSSMFMDYQKEMKFKQAKRLVTSLNQTIPDLELQAGVRVFGPIDLASDSKLQYGMTKYTKAGIEKTMAAIKSTGGGTPQSKSIRVASSDLTGTVGKVAVIIISDAEDVGKTSVQAAKALKDAYLENVCIYTILIGDLPRGKDVMKQIAAAGVCGFATDYASLNSRDGMADFVEKVFLEKVPDSDGDGVLDTKDKCPDTPSGVAVDAKGCPLDSDKDGVFDTYDQCPKTPIGVAVDMKGCPLDTDGDGVYDSHDRCPGTPKGIKVDKNGCPLPIPPKETLTIELNVEFSFDKAAIKPKYKKDLTDFAKFLIDFPDVKVVLEGHTDNLGPEQYNLNLSLRRAEAVKDFLVNNFSMKPERFTTKGYGTTRPKTKNDTKIGRQRNRRVYAILSVMK